MTHPPLSHGVQGVVAVSAPAYLQSAPFVAPDAPGLGLMVHQPGDAAALRPGDGRVTGVSYSGGLLWAGAALLRPSFAQGKGALREMLSFARPPEALLLSGRVTCASCFQPCCGLALPGAAQPDEVLDGPGLYPMVLCPHTPPQCHMCALSTAQCSVLTMGLVSHA